MQSGRKLAHHRSAVDGRRADVAATAGEEEKKEEPPTAGRLLLQVASEDTENEQVSELDGSNRGDGVDDPSTDGSDVSPHWSSSADDFPDGIWTHTAAYHVPKVRFIRCEPLMFNQKAILLLKLINPTINNIPITIKEPPTDEEKRRMIEELKLSAEATVSSSSSSLMLVGREGNKNEGPKSGHFRRTKVVEPPGHSFTTATTQPEVGRMSSNNSSSSTTTHSNNSGGAGTSSIEAEYNEIELRNGWCGVFQVGGQKR
ncbi:dynactin P62 subunit [Culex quinquefasciatus]|uniref:Dynactin P62 subunit n=1 Tax=Culex quinquefasciatus TaxID=7176 RepID=B0XG93_CULQU|nr:dynactin P62 subunit [Culex quinquefasciatus]|eukprot:XP_001868665.1 dynactin P62 subunit [Culex quinquefasciatus]